MIIKGNTVGHPLSDPRKGMTMQGGIDMNGQKLNGIAVPVEDDEPVNLAHFNKRVPEMINAALEVIENGTY